MDGRAQTGKRRRRDNTLVAAITDSEDDDAVLDETALDVDRDDTQGADAEEGTSRSRPVVIVDSGFSTTVQPPEEEEVPMIPTPTVVGSALKRNADGTVAAPRISKRKPKGAKVCSLIFT